MTNYAIPNYTRVYYSDSQIINALNKAGFPSSVVDTMRCICYAESSGSNAIQENQPYSTTGWGGWQITPGNSVPSVGTDMQLLDIYANARAAKVKYDSQGLKAWVTWQTGAYKKYETYHRADNSSSGTAQSSVTAGTITPLRSLNMGSVGDLVRRLQHVLNAWYPKVYKLDESGTYDANTAQAVAGFQQRAGIPVTGIADNATLTKLGL